MDFEASKYFMGYFITKWTLTLAEFCCNFAVTFWLIDLWVAQVTSDSPFPLGCVLSLGLLTSNGFPGSGLLFRTGPLCLISCLSLHSGFWLSMASDSPVVGVSSPLPNPAVSLFSPLVSATASTASSQRTPRWWPLASPFLVPWHRPPWVG